MGQAVVTILIFLPRLPRVMRSERVGLQVLRSGFLLAATLLFFFGFSLVPLADGAAIAQVAPFFIMGLAVLVLGETVGWFRWCAATLGFIGAMVIIQPGAAAFTWGSLLLLGGATMFAAFSISTRVLGRSDPVSTTFLYTGMVGAVAMSLIVPFYWEVPNAVDIPWIVVIGLFGAAGQGMLILALKFAAPQVIAPLMYFQLIWAGSIGYAVFGDVPGTNALIGAAIIVAAGLIVQWRERYVARSKVSENG